MPTLQVKVSEEQLVGLKTYARNNGTTMTELAAAWIDGLLAGTNTSSATSPIATSSPSSSGATSASSSPTSSTSGSGPAISQPADPEQLQLLSRQVELLERLVALQEATPHGGTRAQRRSESEPEVMAGGLMSAADFASPPAPSVPDGYCPAEEAGMAELAQGTEVWMNGLGCTGTVKSPPTQGVYLIQPADRRLGAQHLHIRDLSIRNA